MKCGIVGCGKVVEELYVPSLRALPGLRIALACDVDENRVRRFASRHGVPKFGSDMESFAEDIRNLDFIILATPGFTHYEMLRRLLELNKNVLVEKPIALSYSEVEDIRNRATARGGKVCVGHTWRFRDEIRRAKEAIRKGLVGRIQKVNMVHRVGSIFHVSEPRWSWDDERGRMIFLYEQAFHFLDMGIYLAGPVRRFTGIESGFNPHLQATTHIYALGEFQSGATAWIDFQTFSSSNYSYLEVIGTANDVRIRFFPTSFRIYSGRVNPLDELLEDCRRVGSFVFSAAKQKFALSRIPRRALPHHALLEGYVRSIQDKSVPVPVSVEDALPTMACLEMLKAHVYGGCAGANS